MDAYGLLVRRLLLCGLAALLPACGDEPAAVVATPVRPVKSIVVEAVDAAVVHTFSGIARADVEADISFKVGGTLQSRPVEVGDRVAAHQLLATLDTRDFTIQIKEAEAQLASSRAALRNAQANYDRVRDLYEHDNVARSELDNARAAAESASAQVRIAEQALANHRLQLSYTRLTSPGACSIAATFVKENENVSSGQTIVRLNCGDCAEVRVSVPETQIGGIEVGDHVVATFAALPKQRFAGRVTEVGVAMTSDGSSFPVQVRFEEQCAGIRPGMAADVEFRYDAPAGGRLVVPVVAVGEDRDGRFVFVLEAIDAGHWRVRRRAVEVDEPQSTGIPIVSGLAAGERIVTAGVRRITDGQTVRLYQGGS